MPLLTAEELSFYNMLTNAIDENHAIFTKIPIENIIHPSVIHEKSFLVGLNVDYLICDKLTSLPICVIDVTLPDYQTPLSYFLNISGIAVIQLKDDISAKELREKIAATKPVTSMKYPGELDEILVTLVNGEQPKPPVKKTLPKIIYTQLKKTVKEQLITYGHWGVWIIFGIALATVVIKVFWHQ